MKHGKRFTTAALALALACGLIVGASATSALQTVSAYLRPDVSIKCDGEVQPAMKDAQGNTVYPLTYNGSTYVPIRAISNILGVQVDWDGASKTVLLGDPAAGVDLIEAYQPYVSYDKKMYYDAFASDNPVFVQNADKQTMNIGGETVSHWIGLNVVSRNHDTKPCSFNLGGKYQTLGFKVYAERDMTLYVKGENGTVLGQYSLKGGQVPQTITVDLKNTVQLTFNVEKVSGVDYTGAGRMYTHIFHTVLK